MPRAKRRKATSFETSLSKSVFLYGKPNKDKSRVLTDMQDSFLGLVNRDIQALAGRADITLQLVKNDVKDGLMRKIEKSIRPAGVNSAFCQNAFDMAVTLLSNRLLEIKADMYAEEQDMFTGSKVLFAMSADGRTRREMSAAMREIRDRLEEKNRDGSFYADCAAGLDAMDGKSFQDRMAQFQDSYRMACAVHKVPLVKSVEVPLDSRLMKIGHSDSIRAPFVITITNPFEKNRRFCVPLDTSAHSLHRISSWEMASMVKVRISGGMLKITWACKRSVSQPKTDSVNGVDVGIIDALSCSDGNTCGSMKEVLDYYHSEVEPSFAEQSKLRNKKRAISHYIQTHPSLPEDVGRSLIRKMDRLEKMIQGMEAPYRKKRRYYGMLEEAVSKAVKEYIKSTGKGTLTVLELLDVREFNKSRRVNAMFSTFARGMLQQRLMRELNWRGYDYALVDPAYTSQLCPVCGNVEKANRDGKVFRCCCCGHTDDADHNASVNIRDRFDDEEVRGICETYKYSQRERHRHLKELYAERNEAWRKSQAKQNPPENTAA